MASKASMSGRPALSFCFTWMGYQHSFRPIIPIRGAYFSLSLEERAGVRTVVSTNFVFSCKTEFMFYARPHLCPLPRGEDFGNHGLGDLIDCPANPGARIFKGTANDSPAP